MGVRAGVEHPVADSESRQSEVIGIFPFQKRRARINAFDEQPDRNGYRGFQSYPETTSQSL